MFVGKKLGLVTLMYLRADIQTEDSVTEYECCYNYSRSTFELRLRRRYLYYVIHLIVPYCLFSLIAIVTFIIQPSRPERLNIGMALQVSDHQQKN